MKTTKEAVGWIASGAHLTANRMQLFHAYLLCFGDFPDPSSSTANVMESLINFADGWHYAQDI